MLVSTRSRLVSSHCRFAYQFHEGILVVVPLGFLLARLLRAARCHAHPRVVIHTGHTAVSKRSCAPIEIKGMVCAVVNLEIASRAMFSRQRQQTPTRALAGETCLRQPELLTISLHPSRLHMSVSIQSFFHHHTFSCQTR
jgi:hypothetical protein